MLDFNFKMFSFYSISFFETSSKESININETFEKITEEILKSRNNLKNEKIITLNN